MLHPVEQAAACVVKVIRGDDYQLTWPCFLKRQETSQSPHSVNRMCAEVHLFGRSVVSKRKMLVCGTSVLRGIIIFIALTQI